jgi:hypothetical protein
MTTNVVIPSQFKGTTLSKLVAGVVTAAEGGTLSAITFDFGKLSFVRPAGVVFLDNIINWLKEHGVSVTFCNLDPNAPAQSFLDDSLFFERHCGKKLNPNASPRVTTLPVVQIAHKDSHAWLEANLIPWLAGRLNLTQASLYEVKAVISELFNNI